MPIESTIAAFWNVGVMPAADTALVAGREFMIAARLGEENRPIAEAVEREDAREDPVGEVDRQRCNSRKLRAATEHADGGVGRGRRTGRRGTPEIGPATRKPMVSGSM